MSHFTVLVVGDDHEEALAPFQENNMGDCPEEYLEFDVQVAAADVAKEATELREKKKEDGTLYYPKYANMSDKEVCQEYHGGEWNDKGDLGYWSNPNSKWDWFSVGGRWAGFFKLKAGASGVQGHHRAKDFARISGETIEDLPADRVDQARKGDIDWEGMKADAIESALKSWAVYEEALSKGEVKEGDGYWKFGVEKDDTKESFVKRHSSQCTLAVLLNGEWYERGSMGWWGIVSDEKPQDEWQEQFDKLLSSLPDDTQLTVVDCHI